MPELAAGVDPYKVLQVDPEAEDEVIQAAYRRLAQKYHPDRAAGPDAAARMVAINAAWEMVRDPARRAAFDAKRAAAARSAGPSAPRAGSPHAGTGPSHAGAGPSHAGAGPSHAGAPGARGPAAASARSPGGSPPSPETVSRDWTSGRSGSGGGYDAQTMRAPEGHGAAGPAPGRPSGSVLGFGRYAGWSLGEIARTDVGYLEWLDRMAIGRAYRDEIDAILRRAGTRRSASAEAADRRGLFRRR